MCCKYKNKNNTVIKNKNKKKLGHISSRPLGVCSDHNMWL